MFKLAQSLRNLYTPEAEKEMRKSYEVSKNNYLKNVEPKLFKGYKYPLAPINITSFDTMPDGKPWGDGTLGFYRKGKRKNFFNNGAPYKDFNPQIYIRPYEEDSGYKFNKKNPDENIDFKTISSSPNWMYMNKPWELVRSHAYTYGHEREHSIQENAGPAIKREYKASMEKLKPEERIPYNNWLEQTADSSGISAALIAAGDTIRPESKKFIQDTHNRVARRIKQHNESFYPDGSDKNWFTESVNWFKNLFNNDKPNLNKFKIPKQNTYTAPAASTYVKYERPR